MHPESEPPTASSPPRRQRRLGSLLLPAAAAVLAVLVVALALENRRLKILLAERPDEAPAARPPRLRPGDFFDDFRLRAPGGEIVEVRFDGLVGRTLLFVFTSSCPACTEIGADWNAIAGELAPADTRLIGIQLDRATPLPDPAAAETAFPVFHLADPSEVPVAKLTAVPLTAVLDLAGTVQWARYGVLDPVSRDELLLLLETPAAR